MALDATVRVRVDSKLKENTEKIFNEIGISTSQAITMFLKSVERERGLPTELKIAHDIATSLNEVKEGKTRDVKELLNEL